MLSGPLSRAAAEPVHIAVQAETRHQTIAGFGASIAGWQSDMYRYYYDEKFVDFVANELGASVFRVQLWGGVSPREIADWRDIHYEDFDWTTEGVRGKVNLDFAKALVAANPEGRIIGSVWSGPAWMKVNGSRTGTKSGYLLDPKRDYDDDNVLREDRLQHFAKWIVEWARAMEAQGTPFYALSLQNELMFTQWFESTLYTPEAYARIVRVVGEMFAAEGVTKPLFFGPEDMTKANYADAVRHRPYVDALMQPEVAPYFDVFATHGYSDGVREDDANTPAAYARGIAPFGRPYWITEGGTGSHAWPEVVERGLVARLHVALTRGNVSLFCGWQLSGRPGHANEHNFMEADHPTPKTYSAMHYWKHVRPGAVRVEVPPAPAPGLLASAFVDEARGEVVTILVNTTAAPQDVALDWAGSSDGAWQGYQSDGDRWHEAMAGIDVGEDGQIALTLPGPSITTLVSGWAGANP